MDYVCKSPFHLFIVYLPCVQHDPFTPAFPGPGTGHGRVGNALVDVLKNVSLLSEPMVHPHHPAWAFLNIAGQAPGNPPLGGVICDTRNSAGQ